MALDNYLVLLVSPLLFDDIRIQVVVPTLPALLSQPAALQIFGNKIPFFGPVGVDQVC